MFNIKPKFFSILLILFHLECATMVFSGIGFKIGEFEDEYNSKKNQKIEKECAIKDFVSSGRYETVHLNSLKYKAIGSFLGLIVDIPIAVVIATNEPVTGLKIFGGFIYGLFSLGLVPALNMDSPPLIHIEYPNNDWYSKKWKNCNNSENYFRTIQMNEIFLDKEIQEEDRSKICTLEKKSLIEKAYFSLAENNFEKPSKNLISELKKKLLKPEIFSFDKFQIFERNNKFFLQCSFQIIFYYEGGEKKLKEDFSKL